MLLRNHERTMKLLKFNTLRFVPIQRLLIRKRRHMINVPYATSAYKNVSVFFFFSIVSGFVLVQCLRLNAIGDIGVHNEIVTNVLYLICVDNIFDSNTTSITKRSKNEM